MFAFAELTLQGVSKSYGTRAAHQAVAPLTMTFSPSTSLGVVGESGSGKSTLARMLAGLEQPSTGSVHVNGVSLRELLTSRTGRRDVRRAVQFVGQDTTSSFDPRRTLRWALTDPLKRLWGLSNQECADRVEETLGLLGLPTALADRSPGQVSGGQRQRFAIGRALVVRPQLLICDEVVSALDVSVQGSVLNLLKRYCREQGAGLVFVSHGLPATAFVATEILVMYQGGVVERGASTAVLADPQHSYTKRLVAAHRGPHALPDDEPSLPLAVGA